MHGLNLISAYEKLRSHIPTFYDWRTPDLQLLNLVMITDTTNASSVI